MAKIMLVMPSLIEYCLNKNSSVKALYLTELMDQIRIVSLKT